jgi:hypothetical protein
LIPFKAKNSGHKETDYSIVFAFRAIGYLIGSYIAGKY